MADFEVKKKQHFPFFGVLLGLGILVGIILLFIMMARAEPFSTIIVIDKNNSVLNQTDWGMLFCMDNQTILYDAAANNTVVLESAGKNQTFVVYGVYKHSLTTMQQFPSCVSRDGREVDMVCLTRQCQRVVILNTLNGSITDVWKKGQQW